MDHEQSYYYGEPGGEVKGPLDIKAIGTAVRFERLTKDVMLSRDGAAPWVPWKIWEKIGDVAFDPDRPETKEAFEKINREEEREALGNSNHAGGKRHVEYKVLTQKDKWFSGKFDPVILEKVLNQLASQGWRVVSMASASREGLLGGGGKDELIILLERQGAGG